MSGIAPWPTDSIHVVRHPFAAAALVERGIRNVVLTPDNLSYGPSSANAREHATLRRRFWKTERVLGPGVDHELDALVSPSTVLGGHQLAKLIPPRKAIVLWSANHWVDVLSAWWAMDAVLGLREESDVWVAKSIEVDVPVEAALPRLFDAMAGGAVYLPKRGLREGAAMWARFASSTPARLERVRRERDESTRRLLFNYAKVFPVVRGGVPALSFVDSRILGSLSTARWAGLVDLFVEHRDATGPVFETFGARFLLARLWRWASWRKGAFVARRLKAGAETLGHVEYQLTTRGSGLLNGSERAVAPPVMVGGVVVPEASGMWGCVGGADEDWHMAKTMRRPPASRARRW